MPRAVDGSRLRPLALLKERIGVRRQVLRHAQREPRVQQRRDKSAGANANAGILRLGHLSRPSSWFSVLKKGWLLYDPVLAAARMRGQESAQSRGLAKQAPALRDRGPRTGIGLPPLRIGQRGEVCPCLRATEGVRALATTLQRRAAAGGRRRRTSAGDKALHQRS